MRLKAIAIRHGLEYAVVLTVLFAVDLLPLTASEWIIRRLADAWFMMDGKRRRIAAENIQRCGISESPSEIRSIARASFQHVGVLILDSLKSGQVYSAQNWKDRVELDIDAEAMRLLEDSGQGIILVSGHVGNWEIAAQLLSFVKPVTGVTRPMNNPYVETLVQKRKPRNQFKLTPKYHANALRYLSVLKSGEVLALLTDQHAQSHGMMIEFFGVPAATHTTPAMLHLVSRAPLCLGVCIRRGPMDYLLRAGKPIRFEPTGDREADVRAILEMINRALEQVIREYPAQYLWAHRRWRKG